MTIRKIFTVFVTLLMFVGAAFAFPYDPNPGTINETGTAASGAFLGSWSTTFARPSSNMEDAVSTLRLNEFMKHEFSAGAGKGGSYDLGIWNTPSFNSDKVAEEERAWNALLNAPTTNVPATTGRALATTHSEMVDFIQDLPRTNLTVEYLGEIPRGFPFPFLIFSKGNADRTPDGLRATGKPLVWVQGNIHGNEWSTGEGALTMAHSLANGKHDDLLDKVNVIILPRVCADGVKNFNRSTNDIRALQWTTDLSARDLNRDNVLLDLPVTRAMRKMITSYLPHFTVDLHERPANQISPSVQSTFGILADVDAHDIGSSGTTITQVPIELVALRYNIMEPDLAEFGKKYDIHFGIYREDPDYFAHGQYNNYSTTVGAVPWPAELPNGAPYRESGLTGSSRANHMVNNKAWDPDAPYYLTSEAGYNTRSSRNINATLGLISQLFENKGDTASGRTIWERRVATGYICVLSTLTTAANRGHELVPIIEGMRKEWVEKGKTVTPDDKIPILTITPGPVYVKDREWTIIDLDNGYTPTGARDISTVVRYDGTKALKEVASGDPEAIGGVAGNYKAVKDESGTRDHQFFKVDYTWLGHNIRERIRPYAYIFEGEYAEELASRMLMAGIEVKRLAEDVTIDVEGWKYNLRPYIDFTSTTAAGWRNRDVTVYELKDRVFKKGAYVVYNAQLPIHLIPIYMEPDLPWNVASCIFLPYMSVAMGGAGTGNLSEGLIGVEMPAYRYLKEVDLPTYDLYHSHPLVSKGAVARFFNYNTQEEIEAIAKAVGEISVRVYNYDFQVHARTDALEGGKFDITLPTSKNTKGYFILKKDGTYEKLVPNSTTMVGWNVGTVVIADHGRLPFTVDIDAATGRPVVGDGSNRTIPSALPANDDLIGVRIVEVVVNEILELFKNEQLPKNAILTKNGIKYTEMFSEKATILSDSMLDGWIIADVTPKSGKGWTASIFNGEVVITFTGDAYDETATVKLVKVGTSEIRNLEIEFSGERKSLFERIKEEAGCNAGFALLVLLAIWPVFVRRK